MENEWTAFERTYLLYDGIKYVDVRTDAKLKKLVGTEEIYVNNVYQIYVYCNIIVEEWPELIWLSIKRRNKEPVNDWRQLQRIKNEVIGPENEAIELYPAESRVVDTANQYHLWVLADKEIRFPFGWSERDVSGASFKGGKQRPF